MNRRSGWTITQKAAITPQDQPRALPGGWILDNLICQERRAAPVHPLTAGALGILHVQAEISRNPCCSSRFVPVEANREKVENLQIVFLYQMIKFSWWKQLKWLKSVENLSKVGFLLWSCPRRIETGILKVQVFTNLGYNLLIHSNADSHFLRPWSFASTQNSQRSFVFQRNPAQPQNHSLFLVFFPSPSQEWGRGWSGKDKHEAQAEGATVPFNPHQTPLIPLISSISFPLFLKN